MRCVQGGGGRCHAPSEGLASQLLVACPQGLARRRFMNWDAMLVCGAKRAMGNNTANKPINPYKPDANAWLDGWADVLDVINSHSQVAVMYVFVTATGSRPTDIAFAAAIYSGELGMVPSDRARNIVRIAGSQLVSLNLRVGSKCSSVVSPARAQAMAKLAGVKLSKAALSHVQVPRTRYDSLLLPDAAVQVGVCVVV